MITALLAVALLPLAGAAINGLRAVARPKTPKNRRITDLVALGTTALSALMATFGVVMPFLRGRVEPFEHSYYTWMPVGIGHVAGGFLSSFNVDFAFRVDALACAMLMVVTWIGFLIHVYATGYMAHEEGYTRFFAYLNLFMFMMLLLVLGANYVVMFVGWEGVGLCSYLLIGFYYDKNFAADAGKKAFIVNRIGDFGFILGIFLIFNTFGSADFSKVFALASAGGIEQYGGVATAICLLLFVGACGKSAQIPLHVWLPDAMAGPTPVSALIHAATMVTAGVYMVVRSNVLFRMSPAAMAVVAIIGALTAIFAATIGLAQNDIKKVLAYSTVSQLGYMFLAAGVGAFTGAIFHLMTHAFFKACLFLGAGSVIHGCGGEQDLRRMGGLRKYMPHTHKTMLVATLAISGVPLLAGFFSKDEILANAFHYSPLIWIVGVFTAGLTAFYMFRLYFMTFHGSYRGSPVEVHAEPAPPPARGGHNLIFDRRHLDEVDGHADKAHAHDSHDPHESPRSMTGVLWILAGLSIVGGYVGWPAIWGGSFPTPFQGWLEPVLLPLGGHEYHFPHMSVAAEWILMILSVGIAGLGILLAYRFYKLDEAWAAPKRLATRFAPVHRLLENKYYVDEIYGKVFVGGTLALCRVLWWIDRNVIDGLVNLTRHATVYLFGHGLSLFDRFIVDGAVNGLAWSADRGSGVLRRMQSGMVQNYALIMGGGIILLAVVYLFLKP